MNATQGRTLVHEQIKKLRNRATRNLCCHESSAMREGDRELRAERAEIAERVSLRSRLRQRECARERETERERES